MVRFLELSNQNKFAELFCHLRHSVVHDETNRIVMLWH